MRGRSVGYDIEFGGGGAFCQALFRNKKCFAYLIQILVYRSGGEYNLDWNEGKLKAHHWAMWRGGE